MNTDPANGQIASEQASSIGIPVPKRRVLVLDDEIAIQSLLRVILESEGHEVFCTDDGRIALGLIGAHKIELVIQDLRMPKMDGLSFLKLLKQQYPQVPSIVITAFETFETTIEAMRLGAYTHLNKPFDTEEIRQTVARAIERIDIGKRAVRGGSSPFLDIVSHTTLMADIADLVNRVAPTDSTILITGESGTGKELIARAIHYNSLRTDQAFVPVNCGAFTETLLESELFGHVKGSFTGAIADRKGLFENADRGTLFLDEVGELSPATQVKLLRVLETRMIKPVGGSRESKVDVRFIAATNRNLGQMVSEGQFREDLFYRLNVIPIELPPLRDRKEDIPMLAGYFLARFVKRINKTISGIDDAVIEKLLAYSWPGNVRELENTIERAVALARQNRITLADLSGPVLNAPPNLGRSHVSARMSGASTPSSASARQVKPSGTFSSKDASSGAAGNRPVSSLTIPALPSEGLYLEKWLLDQERALILQALERSNGSLTLAAKLLNMTFRSIRYRVSKLGIERDALGSDRQDK